jgi:calmodulin
VGGAGVRAMSSRSKNALAGAMGSSARQQQRLAGSSRRSAVAPSRTRSASGIVYNADALTEEQVARFKQVFEMFDKDHSGSIDSEELGAAMMLLGNNPTKLELRGMIEALDKDGSGSIDFTEFLAMMANKLQDQDTAEDLMAAFSLFDARKSAKVAVTVLRHALLTIGEKMTDEELAFLESRLPAAEGGKYDIASLSRLLLT